MQLLGMYSLLQKYRTWSAHTVWETLVRRPNYGSYARGGEPGMTRSSVSEPGSLKLYGPRALRYFCMCDILLQQTVHILIKYLCCVYHIYKKQKMRKKLLKSYHSAAFTVIGGGQKMRCGVEIWYGGECDIGRCFLTPLFRFGKILKILNLRTFPKRFYVILEIKSTNFEKPRQPSCR